MNRNEAIPQETCYLLSHLLIAIGAAISYLGVFNVLEGRKNDIPAIRELGAHQIKVGENLAFLSAYVQKGILPGPEIMKYLATR